jgi:hypothetical protein
MGGDTRIVTMVFRSKLLVLAALSLTTAACTTGPNRYTPYQSAIPGKFGFTDQRIEATRYRVTFEGNSATTRQRVEDSLLLRAANLTLENGYDWFQIVNRATDPKTYQVRTPPITTTWSGGFGSGAFGSGAFGYNGGFATARAWSPRHGWVYMQRPYFPYASYNDFGSFGDRDDVRDITRFQASAEIILAKGPKPSDRADAFDARDVTTNLAPRLTGPSVPPA